MSKRFYVDGKSKKASDLTPAQLQLENVALRERNVTAEWYRRMSGEISWKLGERESYVRQFEQFASEITALNGQIAAEEFAALPEG